MQRVKIEEIDKDVYELSFGSAGINSIFVSGAQLRALRDDIKDFFEEEIFEEEITTYDTEDSYSVEDLKDW